MTTKIINVEEFEFNNYYVFVSCTASWCNPCKKIKPTIDNFTHGKIKVSEINIDQKKYQQEFNKYVPFFIVLDKTSRTKLDSIQTSNTEEFNLFINKYQSNLTLDDNF